MDTQTQAVKLSLPEDLKNIKPLMTWADFPVKNETDQECAVAAMVEIKGRIKAIEEKQKELFGPLKTAIRDFEVRVRDDLLNPLKIIRDTLNGRVITFWDAREARLQQEAREAREKQLAEERAAAERAEALAMTTGNVEAMSEMIIRAKNVERLESKPVEVSQTVKTTGGTLAQVKIWAWKIVDESKVPGEFWMIDEKKLNACARRMGAAGGPETDIPGVEFFQKTRTSLRG